jgi:hypothetical protein
LIIILLLLALFFAAGFLEIRDLYRGDEPEDYLLLIVLLVFTVSYLVGLFSYVF